jgi:hypothetical protein
MALSALQATQLAGLLAGHSKLFTANNPGQNEFANYLLKSAQAGQMGLLAEEEEKKRKKKEKGLLGGKIGSALGTAAGLALAPATGGASLALAGAAGGGLGGLAGNLLAGGSPNMGSFAMDTMQGGLAGYTYGKAGELGNSVETGATQPDVPGSPPIAAKVENSISSAMPNANTMSPGTAMGVKQTLPAMPSMATPATAQLATSTYGQPPQVTAPSAMTGAPGAVANTLMRPKFGARFGSAMNHVLNPQPQRKLKYQLPGGINVYE